MTPENHQIKENPLNEHEKEFSQIERKLISNSFGDTYFCGEQELVEQEIIYR